MSKIIIDQLILCKSYADARNICKAFDNFSFSVCFFGKTQVVHAKRFIRKINVRSFSHCVTVRYSMQFKGDFCKYGFLDERTIKRFPELPEDLSLCDYEERYDIISKYQRKVDCWYDIYYYPNFDFFYRNQLQRLLNRIDLVCKVAFTCEYPTEEFEVYYEENGQTFRRGYIANNDKRDFFSLSCKDIEYSDTSPIPIPIIWAWSQNMYYSKNKKGRWTSEARAWVALSYAVNHSGYESLIYSILGLEAVYTKSEKKVKEQLRNSIPIAIDHVAEDDINAIYKLRSEFVHGDISLPLYGERDDLSQYMLVQKAGGLLLETVRNLVRNHATIIRIENGEPRYINEKKVSEVLATDLNKH